MLNSIWPNKFSFGQISRCKQWYWEAGKLNKRIEEKECSINKGIIPKNRWA